MNLNFFLPETTHFDSSINLICLVLPTLEFLSDLISNLYNVIRILYIRICLVDCLVVEWMVV